MKMNQLIEEMWIIIDPHGYGQIDTLRFYKSRCISDFMAHSTMQWVDARKIGWKCAKVKVNVSLF